MKFKLRFTNYQVEVNGKMRDWYLVNAYDGIDIEKPDITVNIITIEDLEAVVEKYIRQWENWETYELIVDFKRKIITIYNGYRE